MSDWATAGLGIILSEEVLELDRWRWDEFLVKMLRLLMAEWDSLVF